MAQCNTQELMGEASCFNCFGYGDAKLVEVVLLCRILRALDPVATCNVQDLLSEAQCFLCLAPQQWEIIKLQLLCNISASIGGSSATGGMTCGVADPVNPPSDPAACHLYANTTNNSLWYWNNVTAAWTALIV